MVTLACFFYPLTFKDHKTQASPATSVGGGGNFQGFQPSGQAEQDWVNLLMMSPLFKQISDLEDLLAKADTTTDGSGGSSGGAPGMVYGKNYKA